MTAELVEFLRARETEREQVARALSGTTLNAYLEGGDDGWAVEGEGGIGAIIGDRNLAAHIARHDPAWVLADVEAKRQIIDEHALLDLPPEPDDDWPLVCRTCEDQSRHDAARWPCKTLRLLALSYAGHPQFREEWAPDAPTG